VPELGDEGDEPELSVPVTSLPRVAPGIIGKAELMRFISSLTLASGLLYIGEVGIFMSNFNVLIILDGRYVMARVVTQFNASEVSTGTRV
jgi:hypothetical protein